MPMIYKVMGVCPQHNLLWETLTAIEHIYFYATLKVSEVGLFEPFICKRDRFTMTGSGQT
jgi:ABC-type multidrug transport system ATPase subunit